jgi:hypothetical protein
MRALLNVSTASLTSDQPALFGASQAVLALARANDDSQSTIVISSLLFGGTDGGHRDGAFHKMRKKLKLGVNNSFKEASALKYLVDRLLLRSPGLCGLCCGARARRVSLHIVHDITSLPTHLRFRDQLVRLHRVEPQPKEVGNEIRFAHYAALLSKPELAWDCVFAIDLVDVTVLKVPPCAALPHVLIAALDVFGVDWLKNNAAKTHYNASWSAALHRLLKHKDRGPGISPMTTAVLGGVRAVFMPALLDVVARFRAHTHFLREHHAGQGVG